LTPAASLSGTATITVTVTDSFGPPLVRTFTVTVGAVADTPSVSNATTNEDTQTTSRLVITRNAADGAQVTRFKILSVTGGTLFQHDGTTPIAPGSFITIAEGGAGLRFTPAPNSFATGHVTVQASIGALDAGLGGAPVTADVQINPVPDTPTVTPATTPEDTQTSSGLVITRNAADGPEITNFKIVDVSNGTLFQNDGTTVINAGDVISAALAGAGLRFTPALNFSGTATFHVIGVLDPLGGFNGTPGIGAGVITVSTVADTPSITNATTIVNAQTTSGLVVSRNAADGAEVTHVKVTAVSGGTLFLNDGFTAVGAGTFVMIAQGAAGLKFTPTTNSAVTGHVSIQRRRRTPMPAWQHRDGRHRRQPASVDHGGRDVGIALATESIRVLHGDGDARAGRREWHGAVQGRREQPWWAGRALERNGDGLDLHADAGAAHDHGGL
jgi:co-chaperonin GroES (HSP10)